MSTTATCAPSAASFARSATTTTSSSPLSLTPQSGAVNARPSSTRPARPWSRRAAPAVPAGANTRSRAVSPNPAPCPHPGPGAQPSQPGWPPAWPHSQGVTEPGKLSDETRALAYEREPREPLMTPPAPHPPAPGGADTSRCPLSEGVGRGGALH